MARFETVTITDSQSVVLQNRTRRTPITEGAYTRILSTANPITHDYEKARVEVFAEKERDMHDPFWLGQELMILESTYADASATTASIKAFCGIVVRLCGATNMGWEIAPTGFDTPNLVLAYQSYLDSDPNDPENAWVKIEAGIKAMDTPLTSVEIRPPEALTPAEASSPLLENVG